MVIRRRRRWLRLVGLKLIVVSRGIVMTSSVGMGVRIECCGGDEVGIIRVMRGRLGLLLLPSTVTPNTTAASGCVVAPGITEATAATIASRAADIATYTETTIELVQNRNQACTYSTTA